MVGGNRGAVLAYVVVVEQTVEVNATPLVVERFLLRGLALDVIDKHCEWSHVLALRHFAVDLVDEHLHDRHIFFNLPVLFSK